MKKFFVRLVTFLSTFFAPLLALAQTLPIPVVVPLPQTPFEKFIEMVGNVVAVLIPLLIGIAIVVFLFGVIKYVIAKGAEDKATAIQTIVWGVVGIFVMVAIWGLVRFVSFTLLPGDDGSPINPPGFIRSN